MTPLEKEAPWWKGAVIYQIYPRSFADGNGDGIGDLAGITDKLPYVAGLGVDGIWLSPFFTSPMKDFGYDVSDYRGVDPIFGTLVDFQRLLRTAHDLGLRVIIDQVYSHSSDQHPWFQASRESRTGDKADWYVWADPKPDGTPPNNWLAVFGGAAWTWEPRRRQYYLHNFLPSQPDLNFHDPEVRRAVLDCARFWLDLGVDGFRVDVANFFCHDPQLRDNPARPHPAPDKPYWLQRTLYNRDQAKTLHFVAEFRALLDGYPGTMAVAEIASEDELGAMARYTAGADRYHTAYSFVFLREGSSPLLVRETLERFEAVSAYAWPSWAFSNHDVVRTATRWAAPGGDPGARAKALIALLASLRGTAFLYQGEELGLPQAEVPFHRLQDPEGIAFWPRHRGRDGARTPMPWIHDREHAGFSPTEPWLPIEPAHRPLAVDRQNREETSTLNFARRFLAWRRGQAALRTGPIRFLDTPDGTIAFERTADQTRILCAFNLSGGRRRLALSPEERARIAFASDPDITLDDTHLILPADTACFVAVDKSSGERDP